MTSQESGVCEKWNLNIVTLGREIQTELKIQIQKN
jgi:hypothetical protein